MLGSHFVYCSSAFLRHIDMLTRCKARSRGAGYKTGKTRRFVLYFLFRLKKVCNTFCSQWPACKADFSSYLPDFERAQHTVMFLADWTVVFLGGTKIDKLPTYNTEPLFSSNTSSWAVVSFPFQEHDDAGKSSQEVLVIVLVIIVPPHHHSCH